MNALLQEQRAIVNLSRTVAGGAAEFSRVIGKIPCLVAMRFSRRGSRLDLAQLVMHVRIGSNGGAHIGADGHRINETHLPHLCSEGT